MDLNIDTTNTLTESQTIPSLASGVLLQLVSLRLFDKALIASWESVMTRRSKFIL